MRLALVTAPTEEPITLAEAKLHLRVEISNDDALITSLITAAREVCETHLKRALVTQTWDYLLAGFPVSGRPFEIDGFQSVSLIENCALQLPMPRLQSIGSITYTDLNGAVQTLASTEYQVVPGDPGYVVPAYGKSWPAYRIGADSITVRFTAGYGLAASVPESIKAAMKLLIGNWYENREQVIVGTIANELPFAVHALLQAQAWGSYV